MSKDDESTSKLETNPEATREPQFQRRPLSIREWLLVIGIWTLAITILVGVGWLYLFVVPLK